LTFALLTGMAGGLALFLLGIEMISKGLQRAGARQIKQFLGSVTRHPISGMLAGLIVTLFLQSSTVTTVLLVGFVSTGLMSMGQALNVVLGAAIGSTLTPQLVAFNISDYALWLVVMGLFPYLLAQRLRWHYVGQALIGMGFILYGASVMAGATAPLKNLPQVTSHFIPLIQHPGLMTVVSALFTAIVQASAATVVLAMNLASQGLIPLTAALAMVLGANLGTTATALISSLGFSREAKRVALAHFFFKLGGVLIFLPFLTPYAHWIQFTSSDISRQVANAHTLFNVINMAIFLPLTPWVGKLMVKILPDRPEEEGVTKYLDPEALEVPSLALENARKETLRMASIIQEKMFPRLFQPLAQRETHFIEKMEQVDTTLDHIYQALVRYLSQLQRGAMEEEELLYLFKLLYIASDLEHIGDALVTVAYQYKKLEHRGKEFTPEEEEDLKSVFSRVEKNYLRAIKAFATENKRLAAEVIRDHPEILKLEKRLRFSHCQRIRQGDQAVLEVSAIHMEILNQILAVEHHVVGIAQAVLGII